MKASADGVACRNRTGGAVVSLTCVEKLNLENEMMMDQIRYLVGASDAPGLRGGDSRALWCQLSKFEVRSSKLKEAGTNVE